MSQTYTPTIGLEVHAELNTTTKMFCGSRNEPHAGEPNTHICPICMGHPGTLPVINKEAVKNVLRVGVALEGTLATYTEFDRKNYFYPDIPKGYQISQYKYPLVSGGTLAGVDITRIHLEEDTARSMHDVGESSLVDYNRAGVPLMELVTEPVIHDAKTAGNFARELQLLLRFLGVSFANMEKGEMRVEANISVSATLTRGTKVEVKNLNSFRSVEMAIAYEIERQTAILERGEIVTQETRGWDENRKETYTQRRKESSHDYRYFPDPDLPSLDLSKIDGLALSRIAETMPELPSEIRTKFSYLGLTRTQIETIIADQQLLSFFRESIEGATDPELIKIIANYLTSDVVGLLSSTNKQLHMDEASVSAFRELASMVNNKKINSKVAKELLPAVIFEGVSPQKLAEESNLLVDSSVDSLLKIVGEVIDSNPEIVLEVQSGKTAALQYLVGQGMKISRGTADPMLLRSLFEKQIGDK